MSYLLLDRRNPNGDHFYARRNEPILALVVHITAGLQDLDGVDDHSAENTAQYAATTSTEVSWHSGSDADSIIDLLPPNYTAWHASNYNSCTYGHEISKTHTDWRTVPPEWVDKTLRNAARKLSQVAREFNVPLRKATRAEVDAQRANYRAGRAWQPVGLISHAELQPADRTDPGWVSGVDTFPWGKLLAYMGGTDETEEDDPMFQHVFLPATAEDEVREVIVGLPWQGGAGGVGSVWVTIGAANAPLKLQVAHWRIHEGGTSRPLGLVEDGTTLEPLTNTGGQQAPKNTASVVIDYTSALGGFVLIEAAK